MTDRQINAYRAKTDRHFCYICPKCAREWASGEDGLMDVKQLWKLDVESKTGECVDCGVVDLGRFPMTIAFTPAQAKLYLKGKRAMTRHKLPVQRPYDVVVESPRIEAVHSECGDGCGCPLDTTGRPTKYNNYGGHLLDIGFIKGRNLTGPNGEFVLKGGPLSSKNRAVTGFGSLMWPEPYIHGRGWVETHIERRFDRELWDSFGGNNPNMTPSDLRSKKKKRDKRTPHQQSSDYWAKQGKSWDADKGRWV